jgi:hypothetical protein
MRVPVGVEVLHLVLIDVRLLDLILRSEAMLELVAGAEIPQLHLHHRAEVSGGVVVEFEDFAQVTAEEDDHAFSEICCLHARTPNG